MSNNQPVTKPGAVVSDEEVARVMAERAKRQKEAQAKQNKASEVAASTQAPQPEAKPQNINAATAANVLQQNAPQPGQYLHIPEGRKVELRYGDRIITVSELDPEQILDFFGAGDPTSGGDIVGAILAIAPKAITGIEPKELLKLKPSQLQVIWEQFKAVNQVFLAVAAAIGLEAAVHRIIEVGASAIAKELESSLQSSFAMAIKKP